MSFFDTSRFHRMRRARALAWGTPLEVFEETSSTNDRAGEAQRSATPSGAVWLAREQTKGRGRRGRSWLSPAGDGLMLSLLLRGGDYPGVGAGLTLAIGLAVREVVAARLPQDRLARVKWPNDVLVNGQKIAGILVEGRPNRAHPDTLDLIVGIGINVHTQDFASELSDLRFAPTSLAREGAPFEQRELEPLLADLLAGMHRRIVLLQQEGCAQLSGELDSFDALRGLRLRTAELEGTAVGLSAQGHLLLRDDAGTVHELISADFVVA